MTQIVTNKTSAAVFPNIVDNDSRKISSIRIMPKGKVQLPANHVVEANWLARNPNTINVFEGKA